MNRQKAIEWIGTHRVGISSRTMWCGLMGIIPNDSCDVNFDIPGDADDFSRCFDLVEFAEVTDEDLRKILVIFPYYKPIIDVWGKLVNAYICKNYECVFNLLHDCYDEVMNLKGFKKIGTGHYILKRNNENVKENE